jgi:hypothetical protein
MSFVMHSWRDGTGGSFRMGVEHAVFCLGCCWLLFLILFPLGMMNVAVLAIVTALIFAEKVLPRGRQIAYAAGAALVLYGALVVFVPDALPMAMADDEMSQMEGMESPAMDGEMTGGDEMEAMPGTDSGMEEGNGMGTMPETEMEGMEP